ncbi:hypothetical protein BN1051_02186 [Arthrobacter saudimassiliensis]|uniref:Uncharacterized protein n=1 Tax=Arthrobacter saudimassiliensis TaxID=1461584 RepID=A0A078MNL5_9MICC|nr:hypothetical protein BN1051_02186 [Arthrobacter saudimassiliensis]
MTDRDWTESEWTQLQMQEMREHVILRLLGRQPIWMRPDVITPDLDAADAWPELFAGLSEDARRAVREAWAGSSLAARGLGRPAPTRAMVAELAAEARERAAGDGTWPSPGNRRR